MVLLNALLFRIAWFDRQVVHRSADRPDPAIVGQTTVRAEDAVWGRITPSAEPTKARSARSRGLFTLLMCAGCQAARASSNHGLPTTRVGLPSRDPDQPAELLAHHDPGQPWYQWGCPLPGCDWWVILPWDLEAHAAADHPG